MDGSMADGWSIEQVAEFVAEVGFPQYQVRRRKQPPSHRALLCLSSWACPLSFRTVASTAADAARRCSQGTFVGNYINGWRLLNQITSSAQLSSMGIMDWDHQKAILNGIKSLREQVEQDLFNQEASMIDYAAELGLEGTAEEDAAAAKMQAIQRGRQDRRAVGEKKKKKIEDDLGLTGSAEEQASIAKMQAAQRGKQDRRRVADMKGKAIEDELGLTGSPEEQASIAKMQAAQRGKQDRRKVADKKKQKIEDDLGLTGSPEEQASIAKMQAAQRGKQDRRKVADMKGKAIEDELGLTGSPEEQASIAKMQAAQRGKQDRKKVADMKAAKAGEGGEEVAAPDVEVAPEDGAASEEPAPEVAAGEEAAPEVAPEEAAAAEEKPAEEAAPEVEAAAPEEAAVEG